MLLSDFLTPVADDLPCGEDLDDTGDQEYYNYVIPARDKLPKTYFIFTEKGENVLFDPSTIKADAEEQRIFQLLKRTRDLRLIILLAQFRILGGDLAGFTEALEYMSTALQQWWMEFHPAVVDGDAEMREITLNGIENRAHVLLPLAFTRIAQDRKAGIVSLRRYQTGKRPELAFPSEPVGEVLELEQAVISEANREEMVEALGCAQRAIEALDGIRDSWINSGVAGEPPEFPELRSVLGDMVQFLGPAAKGSSASVQAASSAPAESPKEEKHGLLRAVRSVFSSEPAKPGATKLSSHADARNLLIKIEDYFRNIEPSSPAGLLVRQARLLIGRPLIEALEALAPSRVDTAAIVVDEGSGFRLDAGRIRALCAGDESENSAYAARARSVTQHNMPIETRGDVFNAIQSIEEFLFETEPSSPVPMLLAQARSFMNMDFAAIMKELLNKPQT